MTEPCEPDRRAGPSFSVIRRRRARTIGERLSGVGRGGPLAYRRIGIGVGLFFGFWFSGLSVLGQPSREVDLKAAFLYNFLSFVEWPEVAFEDEQSPFVIGVLGDDRFGDVLEQMVAGETVEGRPSEVRRVRRAEDVASVHILFVGSNESWRLNRLLRAAADYPVLTVGDAPGFAHRGGMIEFRRENNYIRLTINRQTAGDAGLRISTKLLQLAQVVGEREEAS